MWISRAKQILVNSGVALIVLNPILDDEWDWDAQDTRRLDVPFLGELFRQIRAGEFGGLAQGTLDLRKVFPLGYSAGAQVASWLAQLKASGEPALRDVGIAGLLMLSGGSYRCYAQPPLALAQCQGCTLIDPTRAALSQGYCSSDLAPNITPACDYCCPVNYTEQWFQDHPADYALHPPAFLAQLRTADKNADLCAGRHYHDTLRAHGVNATLVLPRAADETCFCVGTPDNPAAAGSPFLDRCGAFLPMGNCTSHEHPDELCCEPHATGFADMVEPMVDFVLEAVSASS